MDIMTLGEVLIDLTQTELPPDGIRRFAAYPGGAPANVAVAAARLGARTGFIGKVGLDSFGKDLKQVLRDNGVDTSGLYQTEAAPTTLAIVSVNRGERSFSFYRSPGADTLLEAHEVLNVLREQKKPVFLHLGSLSLTAEPARSASLAALEYARDNGICVSYDPNYRASLWPSEKTAVRWMKTPLPFADILKVSDEELLLLTKQSDLDSGCEKLASYGPKLILVTLGAEGVYYRLGEHSGRVPGCSVSVTDTNGAGDTFLGALLSRLARRPGGPLAGLEPEELGAQLAFANRAAALTCSRSGAIPAMPTAAELED